jgi:hypothetical protein
MIGDDSDDGNEDGNGDNDYADDDDNDDGDASTLMSVTQAKKNERAFSSGAFLPLEKPEEESFQNKIALSRKHAVAFADR